MKLPEITALQFAVLSLLMAGEKTSRQLQHELRQWDGPASSGAFSQLIGRMRPACYVRTDPKCVGVTLPGTQFRDEPQLFPFAAENPGNNSQPLAAAWLATTTSDAKLTDAADESRPRADS